MDTVSGIVLVILVLVIIAWFGTEMVVMRRFRVMLDMAERVRQGDLDARTGFDRGKEELTRLGNALDDMVQELKNRDEQLREAMLRLGEQAVTDQLTGLPNRRYLWGALESELIRARRRKSPIAVMMLDIDHFKEFNDAHGHEAGDLVLKSVAGALRRVVRGSDIVARHGGEEFVIVLPDAGEASAQARAEELRRGIAALRLDYCGKPLEPVTLSVGIAVSADAHESVEALVRAADDAMYEAKRSGRDRVVFGQPESGAAPE
jgi:diguanylate cyclase (GGDEF)-like protein